MSDLPFLVWVIFTEMTAKKKNRDNRVNTTVTVGIEKFLFIEHFEIFNYFLIIRKYLELYVSLNDSSEKVLLMK